MATKNQGVELTFLGTRGEIKVRSRRPIVRGDPSATVRRLGRERGIDARLAHDGNRLSFPAIDLGDGPSTERRHELPSTHGDQR